MSKDKALRNVEFHEGLALGLFLTAVACAITYGAVQDWRLNQETIADLFLGSAAILAAFFSVRSIRLQMQQERELTDEQRLSRLAGKRAQLGFALHDLHDIFLACVQQLWRPHEDFTLDWGRITERCFKISECIEDEEGETARNLAELMNQAQIVCARHKSLLESRNLTSLPNSEDLLSVENTLVSRSEAIDQLFEFLLVSESAFKYARLEQDDFFISSACCEDLEKKFQFRVDLYAEMHPLWPTLQRFFQNEDANHQAAA
ncbi:hypothetical protein [Ruegeria sp.]|uniref:hypothetical protein n=1 Tax=Ruegeria sp. TaxID=1879320 RepID=UPI003C7BD3B9